MATNCCNDNWVQFNSHENQCFEDEEEALSLCDLPTNEQEIEANSKREDDDDPEDFEFGSCHGGGASLSPENMCNAEEVFFQGQILPLRHSVSSDGAGFAQKINRSALMSVVSSRSSSLRSHNSTSSLSLSLSSTSTTSNRNDPRIIRSNGYKYKPRIRNQFHSHPSPSPQIRTQSFRSLSHSNPKTSSLWSFLQVGLVKPQEIGLSDLKNRSKRFGSHNSNSSSTSSSMNSTIDQNQNQNQNLNKIENPGKKTKKKQRLFFGGCKCSANSVESTIKDANSKKKTTNGSSGEATLPKLQVQMSTESSIGEGKQAVSRHRTFEWLKQLSIATPSEA